MQWPSRAGTDYVVLVRGPPGTGKTQMSAAVIDAWTRNLSKGEIVIAAGPSNTATDNLLDRIADIKGRDYGIGRLGEGSSVFDPRRVRFSLADQGTRTSGKDAKKSVINKVVRQLIAERRHPVIFTTYMKSAEVNGTSPFFTLADEAGQATEPTSAVLLANAVEGGRVMIVGDEHQLAPTVKDQRAEWDGLSCSLLARLNRNRKGLKHIVMLEIQYRMRPDIQSFPNMQYYDGVLKCGFRCPPEIVKGVPWPDARGKRPGTDDTGDLAEEREPCHRVMYIHCSGQELNNDSSPSNRMQADAVEYILNAVHRRYTNPPSVLVLTPYRGQHALLTRQLAEYSKGQVKVSTIDAAHGQEADLVIISFVRANATGSVGFTDDAKRLNVAIARAKAGVIIVGHLATSLAASTSGFGSLLYELRKQGSIYDYQHGDTNPPMIMMTEEVFKKYEEQFPADTTEEQRRRKREGKDRASHADSTYDTERASEGDVKYAVEKTRRYPIALMRSTSFMLAMSHVCSLGQKIEYNNDTPDNNVADWDRKAWSFQNFFSTPGVSVDPGNFILGTMFLSIRHALGMEPPLDPDRQSDLDITGSSRPAPWDGNSCTRHPIVTGSATAGMARKPGYCQVITNMSNQNVQPAECLRVVIETLMHDEEGHQVSLDTKISNGACERMGDVLEAAGGLVDPYTPAAKPFMMSMHEPHGIDMTNDAGAFRNLQGLAQGTKELAAMLPTPKASDRSPGDSRTRTWAIIRELRPDGLTLKPNWCKGCWVCNEITRLGGSRLLNEDGSGPALRDVPERIYSVKKFVKFGRGWRIRVSTGAHLKPRRAWTRDRSN